MAGLLLMLLGLAVAAYFRTKGWLMAVAAAVGALLGGSCFWAVVAGIVGVVLCITPLRRRLISNPVFGVFKKVTPPISDTEVAAINAGTVWWDGELFSGKPDFAKLQNYRDPKLSEEEQAFIDGPVEQLCAMLDDWEIVSKRKDLPPEAWQFIKEQGFLGMIIQKQYGGLQFSNYAHAKVVTKIGTRCGSAAVTVMVPNSLGPGELLQHYGTQEQKNYYLPRLAKGIDIPCFALTSPSAGSDAGGIPDFGVVCRGSYTDPRTGEHFDDVLGVRVSWEKRWITLAPIATVLGLAFKMYDPDGLLGDKKDIGITCALVPANYEGVQIGRRHYPSGSVFMNGPTWGKDVFIPLDWIIGGVAYAGKGWQMLVECLSVGRCISLPANAVAAGKMASYTTSLYARIRDQFGLPIGRFEGVDEALARIGGYTYQMEASQDLALTALDLGEKPSVISAMLKYHNTERMRKTINDAMDIHGGRAVVWGPRNYLASGYQSIPIAITVEGANILTRSMMIFGQGAFRCHPYVLKETQAATQNNLTAFDQAFSGHVHFATSNAIRSFWLGLTNGCGSSAPSNAGAAAVYYRRLNRLSAAFAIAADISMLSLGGSLKFREKLSARLGDILSNLYITSAVLKRFERDGRPAEDVPFMQYAAELALYDAETALQGLVENLPKSSGCLLRLLTLPIGRRISPPSDKLGTQVANAMMQNGAALERLTQFVYVPKDESEAVGVLAAAHRAVVETEALEKKLRGIERENGFAAVSPATRLQEALERNLITQDEFDAVTRARALKRQVIMVDDFDMTLSEHDRELLQRHVF